MTESAYSSFCTRCSLLHQGGSLRKNIGDKARTFDGADQKLFDRNGSKYSADTAAGLHLDGIVVFDIPRGADPVRIELHDSLFSGGTTVDLTGRR
ncbi:DUF4352 domain-containing protein [Streptomyces sp. NPDC001549]|uniref:DUF4352 domain-containing protein n=1 Tax=Streptomyces sp. NPDC001549 TaxID=3364586 RepID=UPI0036B7A8D8